MVGLSKYEARAYLGLIALGVAPADRVANVARIPRTSAYKVLDSLCEKDFATSTKGRPKVYRPVAPQKLQEKIVEDITELFSTIKTLGDVVSDRGLPLLVYSINSQEKVIKKVIEMIEGSTDSIKISSPVVSQMVEFINKPVQNAIKRGVSVIIITHPSQRVPENTTVYRRVNLVTTEMIIDDSLALITTVEMNACGFTDNQFITQHLLNVFNILSNQN